ncbi:hypothetical protein [Streptomyces sp. NBC_01500]|uniref:hypothetical protein n=1 Tax=Streptomyces sp. NBC_01500 TaxID=2903886 RepID=UPI0022570B25|nr:hypothetical protein [Streptomyces sp. NBC_01500]MCX4554217.1 hypothetical protein [Streptomyces sp. NBC_01500]
MEHDGFFAYVCTVAGLLGHGWTAAPTTDFPGAVLLSAHHPGTPPYRIRVVPEGERLVMRGILPKQPRGVATSGISRPEITVSSAAGPEYLASHIRRRLLAPLAVALNDVSVARAEYEEKERAKVRTVERLLATLPGTNVREGHRYREALVLYRNGWSSGLALRCEIERDGVQVGVEVSGLSPEQAEQVFALLSTME